MYRLARRLSWVGFRFADCGKQIREQEGPVGDASEGLGSNFVDNALCGDLPCQSYYFSAKEHSGIGN